MLTRFIANFARPTLLLVSVAVLSSCAFISDRASEYKTAEESERIRVPQGLTDENLGERFAIPSSGSKTLPPGKYVLPSPPDATAALNDEPYNIVIHDGGTWLELPMSPSKAWPQIEEFWVENGVISRDRSVGDGYFATEELIEGQRHDDLIEALEATDHQPIVISGMSFQAKLTQGLRRNTSELQVRAFLPNTPVEIRESWQASSVTPSLERAMLDVIGSAVTSSNSGEGRYSLNAVNIGDESLLRMLEDEAGYPYIQIQLNFDRAWKEVSDALGHSNVIVASSAKDQGVVYVSYLDQEEIESWYTLESTLDELKGQKNIELRFYAEGPDLINVRAKLISDELEPESVRELIETVFSLIS